MPTDILNQLTIVIPAKNEAQNLASHLSEIVGLYPNIPLVVVDDGSSDSTGEVARNSGATVITHPYSLGNGGAIKSGARAVKTKYVLFMDADGQHKPEDIKKLVESMASGFKMVIGARVASSHASLPRRVMNLLYNGIASMMTGIKILDLTSGFRIVESKLFNQFIYLLPNGFSYPTTITMAFLRSGLPIRYVSIEARQREGKSKIRPLHDGVKFLIIIMKVGALFSPMRLFLPISLGLFTVGVGYYLYTFLTENRFTNMGAVLLLTSILVFLIGIISEQISSLHYQASQPNDEE
ncbi:MAG: glycosyltransferase family 2 protein [Gammaproteobacteria bacterium]|nr:glycosyltransferase family 2 protein [Gammaproteobacteria bacterium]